MTNFVTLLTLCAWHPGAANETFLVAEDPPISTGDLVRAMSRRLHGRGRVIPVPVACLRLAARLVGKLAEVEKLTSDLEVDSAKARLRLGWRPAMPAQNELNRMIDWYARMEKR